ncbi:MAG: transpeptidase family protein [Marinilabiliaceae bacterium]|nr:transpeptidase family protein [Marinilabiliaceae bacterium]
MKLKRDILWRVGTVYIGMVLLSFAILFQIIKLQFVERFQWQEQAALLKVEDVIIDANRGSVLSDDGRKLACSVPGYKIYMDTRAAGLTPEVFKADIDSLSLCLSRLFRDKSAAAYKQAIVNARKKGMRYYQISNQRISIIDLKRLKKFPIFRLGANKGGLIVVDDESRKLPFGSLASRTIGKFSIERDSLGRKQTRGIGLEIAYNEVLQGKDGVGDKTRIGGRWVHDVQVHPVDGDDVVTTINVEIQDVAEQTLRDQLMKHNARYGTAVVMEVKTGAVKAIVNLHRAAPGRYVEDHFNYAIGEAAEPGSTFKLASMMVALEDGVVDLDDVVDTEDGSTKYYDRTLRDSEGAKGGRLTIRQVFANSSNVGISKVIFNHYRQDPEDFLDGIAKLGINQKMGIEIPGEVPPYIKNTQDKSWSGTTIPWMSIGYEVKMTPLQILTLYNAVANNGTMVRPSFVKGISRHGKIIETFDADVIKSSICSRSTLRKVRELLEEVVENGTAQNLKNSHYKIAGKTGTAQVAKGAGGYGTKGYRGDEGGVSYQASFVGYFPADEPLYSCIVVVNSPSNNVYYGNVISGAVFKAISDRLYAASFKVTDDYKEPAPLLTDNLPYTKAGNRKELRRVLSKIDLDYDDNADEEWVGVKVDKDKIELVDRQSAKGLVPNVKGYGARDAVSLLESLGLRVYVTGFGKVVSQSIAAGARIKRGSTIVLHMS